MFFSSKKHLVAFKVVPKNRKDVFDGVFIITPYQHVFLEAADFNELYHFGLEAVDGESMHLSDLLKDRAVDFQLGHTRQDGTVLYFDGVGIPFSEIQELNSDLYDMNDFVFIPEENCLEGADFECKILLQGGNICVGSLEPFIVKDVYKFYESLFKVRILGERYEKRMNLF